MSHENASIVPQNTTTTNGAAKPTLPTMSDETVERLTSAFKLIHAALVAHGHTLPTIEKCGTAEWSKVCNLATEGVQRAHKAKEHEALRQVREMCAEVVEGAVSEIRKERAALVAAGLSRALAAFPTVCDIPVSDFLGVFGGKLNEEQVCNLLHSKLAYKVVPVGKAKCVRINYLATDKKPDA